VKAVHQMTGEPSLGDPDSKDSGAGSSGLNSSTYPRIRVKIVPRRRGSEVPIAAVIDLSQRTGGAVGQREFLPLNHPCSGGGGRWGVRVNDADVMIVSITELFAV